LRPPHLSGTLASPYLAAFFASRWTPVSTSPFDRPLTDFETVVPLTRTFTFAHEPVSADDDARYVGREREVHILAERLFFSNGGSFLVTGYRGVGKTSFVNQVIHQLHQRRAWAEARDPATRIRVIHVQLNLARALQPAELMHHIIRRLYETLVEVDAFVQLPEPLQAKLTEAYDRTSFNMTRKLAQTSERNLGLPDVSMEGGGAKLSFKGFFNVRRSAARNDELAFLGYDDRAAEFDIIHLSRQLARGFAEHNGTRARSLRRVFRRTEPHHVRFKLIFVFDELDKLDELPAAAPRQADEGVVTRSSIEELLNSLKTLFTTSGISFVFVAGKDLQERWQDDVGRGDSVYESVFSYHKYLPCMWTEIDQISSGVVDWSALEEAEHLAPALIPNAPTTHTCPRCSTVNCGWRWS
jgi:serine/threonine-protein kinase